MQTVINPQLGFLDSLMIAKPTNGFYFLERLNRKLDWNPLETTLQATVAGDHESRTTADRFQTPNIILLWCNATIKLHFLKVTIYKSTVFAHLCN
jgi:hypothetical protein